MQISIRDSVGSRFLVEERGVSLPDVPEISNLHIVAFVLPKNGQINEVRIDDGNTVFHLKLGDMDLREVRLNHAGPTLQTKISAVIRAYIRSNVTITDLRETVINYLEVEEQRMNNRIFDAKKVYSNAHDRYERLMEVLNGTSE